ncbi:MAG: SPOR domain-containing protein, partial [Ignavibacteriaceae bacterium]
TTTIEEKQETTPNVTEERSSRIFLYKNYYVVYIGSFNSSEAANREADKYYDLGYNAFVEVIEKRGGRAEYKLNVGDFTSEEFARQFETKYLRK